jgi:signal transduction histidine kinase
LLEPALSLSPRYERQLDETYAAIDSVLTAYEPVLGTVGEREQVERLRREVDHFRTITREVLQTRKTGRAVDIRALLNDSLVPRREAAVRVSEEVQALNRAAFVQHQRDIVALHRQAERRTWQQVGLALVASIAIAIFFTLYAGRLEARLQHQIRGNEQATRELQQLSSRLVRAQEEERRNVARELHDEVGQALTAVQVELSIAERRLNAAGYPQALLNDAGTITHRALETVRDISQLLHPAVLDDLGLAEAVEWQAKAFEARHRLVVHVEQEATPRRYAREVELAAYRIIQEALTNVARHSRASMCRIVLSRHGDALEISVEDDGLGFDAAGWRTERKGLGLVGMRERTAMLSGGVALESERGSAPASSRGCPWATGHEQTAVGAGRRPRPGASRYSQDSGRATGLDGRGRGRRWTRRGATHPGAPS